MNTAETHTVYSLKTILNGVGTRINELNTRMGGAIYVKAEISEFKFKPGFNHQYFILIEKNGDSVEAKVSAHLWKTSAQQVLNNFYRTTGQRLECGMEVVFLVCFDFSPLYGLSLNIIDIDATYTLGKLAQARQATIKRLEDEELMDMNKRFHFPDLPNRIAVISSDTAAGYEDFLHRLGLHPEFRFEVSLYPATMQGQKAPSEIIAALKSIQNDMLKGKVYDLVAIMRGGGAEIDLVAFDDYNLCAEIARFSIPVATGIGHTKDVSVADMVSNVCKNTPTGLADFFLDKVSQAALELSECVKEIKYIVETEFEKDKSFLNNYLSALNNSVSMYLKDETYLLQDIQKDINNTIARKFSVERNHFAMLALSLKSQVNSLIEKEKHKVERNEIVLSSLSPDEMLKRGYSLTFKDGKVAKFTDIKNGDVITTMFAGGKVESVVNNIKTDN